MSSSFSQFLSCYLLVLFSIIKDHYPPLHTHHFDHCHYPSIINEALLLVVINHD